MLLFYALREFSDLLSNVADLLVDWMGVEDRGLRDD